MTEITIQKSSDSTNRSAFQTMESDTLVNTLYDAIHNEWSSHAIRVIIKELLKKGYDRSKLLNLVENKFGKDGSLKVAKILTK